MGSDSGGHRAASLYSLIGTARLNGLDAAFSGATQLVTVEEEELGIFFDCRRFTRIWSTRQEVREVVLVSQTMICVMELFGCWGGADR
jgi:hypothetical protein